MDLNVQLYQMSKSMRTQLYIDNLTAIFNPQAVSGLAGKILMRYI